MSQDPQKSVKIRSTQNNLVGKFEINYTQINITEGGRYLL